MASQRMLQKSLPATLERGDIRTRQDGTDTAPGQHGMQGDREWKFQKDTSIAGPDNEKCELVTPILTYADMENLQELIRQAPARRGKSDASEDAESTFIWSQRPYAADASQPCKHYGKP